MYSHKILHTICALCSCLPGSLPATNASAFDNTASTAQIGPSTSSQTESYCTNGTGRGRPIIDTALGFRRVLTDANTLLRGVSLSFDGGDPYDANNIKPIPPIESFIKLKNQYAINSIHCYLEGNSSQNPNAVGVNQLIADQLVEITRNLDFYLVLTIGCNGTNGQIHSLQKALDFWSLYADRYKEETHVIFEAHNEPAFGTINGWSLQDWEKQSTLYNHIRALAPDSLILLGSFMSFYERSAGGATWGADYLKEKGVTWENTAFAFHGYWEEEEVFETVDYFQASTDYPALVCTEFNPYSTEQGDGFNNLCESRSIGWLQFEWFSNDNNLLGFKGRADKVGTIWQSDFSVGNWPVENDATIPTGKFGLYCRGNQRFLRISGSTVTANLSTYLGTQDEQFEVIDAGNGLVAIQAGSGNYLSTQDGTTAVDASATALPDAQLWQWFTLPTGDIALRAYGRNARLLGTSGTALRIESYGALVNSRATFRVVHTIRTEPPPIKAYYGSPQSLRSKVIIYAADYDHGGQGIALYDSDGDAEGDLYRRDGGADLQSYGDGTPYIAWFDSGEWLKYTISVAESNDYSLMFRVASGATGRFHVEFDGTNKTGTLDVGDTGGWDRFTMLRAHGIPLAAGEQEMKIVSHGGFNLMSIQGEVPGKDPPNLSIQLLNDKEVVLQWPTSPALYTVENRSALNNASVWNASTIQPGDPSGYVQSVRLGVDKTSGSKFFRLQPQTID